MRAQRRDEMRTPEVMAMPTWEGQSGHAWEAYWAARWRRHS